MSSRHLLLVVLSLPIWACGDDDVCMEAIDKWNKCADTISTTSDPVPQIAWNGPCEDGVTFKLNGPTGIQEEKVELKSWSEIYVGCTPDPKTCLCPGQSFLIPGLYP